MRDAEFLPASYIQHGLRKVINNTRSLGKTYANCREVCKGKTFFFSSDGRLAFLLVFHQLDILLSRWGEKSPPEILIHDFQYQEGTLNSNITGCYRKGSEDKVDVDILHFFKLYTTDLWRLIVYQRMNK